MQDCFSAAIGGPTGGGIVSPPPTGLRLVRTVGLSCSWDCQSFVTRADRLTRGWGSCSASPLRGLGRQIASVCPCQSLSVFSSLFICPVTSFWCASFLSVRGIRSVLCYPDPSIPELHGESVQSAILPQKAKHFSLLIQWGRGFVERGEQETTKRTR